MANRLLRWAVGTTSYDVIGDSARPIFVIHGGPGAGHEYVSGFEALADEHCVVLYDQIGCGQSNLIIDPASLQLRHFVLEIEALRAELGCSQIILAGHSWGGFVALEYALAFPAHVRALVLASSAASAEDVEASHEAHLRALDHLAAAQERDRAFLRQHICRTRPLPETMRIAGIRQAESAVYRHLYGPDEFTMTGKLKGWDRKRDLSAIACPTLITAGEHDQLGPVCWQPLARSIPRARVRIFPGCSHVPHIEQPDAYFNCIRDFLR